MTDEVEVEVEPATFEELESSEGAVVTIVKEPMRHQIGKQALGFAMAFVAERASDVLYEALLRSYRKWRVR